MNFCMQKDEKCKHKFVGNINVFWVKKIWSQTNVLTKMLGVNIFGVAVTERSACAMGKRGPPLAYAIYIKRIAV